ncbi:hypothetical protein BRD10_02885 [Halobacteriales archaeon SW_12_71_31]|nr:MAG: hypothetical protein BRD10_02885 [Halobacteriales archaeon SW_12_71_31]
MTQATDHDDDAPEPDTSHLDDTAERSSSSDRAHLDTVEDGCGCAEVWEHLSEERADASD